MSENKIYSSIAELVGNTPLVELGNYEKQHDLHARVLAKLEYFNPSGSVKDRAALSMILDAEKKGKIKPGDTIIDFTSGNTGIALAAYANALGYKFAVVLQPGVSAERTQILKAYGCTFLEFKDIPGVVELIKEEGLVFEKFYNLIQQYAAGKSAGTLPYDRTGDLGGNRRQSGLSGASGRNRRIDRRYWKISERKKSGSEDHRRTACQKFLKGSKLPGA